MVNDLDVEAMAQALYEETMLVIEARRGITVTPWIELSPTLRAQWITRAGQLVQRYQTIAGSLS